MTQQFTRYLNQIPEDFEMCFKAWEEIIIPSYASHNRYGSSAGQPNPQFLDAQLFKDFVLAPLCKAQFEAHTGPFLFEFQRHGMSASEFLDKLDQFFSQQAVRIDEDRVPPHPSELSHGPCLFFF